MCGYFFSNDPGLKHNELSVENIKRRGPENYNVIQNENGIFIHSLLHTIGEKTSQPISNNYGTLLYNGCVYNSPGTNDSKWISDSLDDNKDNNIEVIKSLRGEYSLVYVTSDKIYAAIDQWNTRSLFMYVSDDNKFVSFSVLPDTLRQQYGSAIPLPANKIVIVDRATCTLEIIENYKWNLDQKVNNYDLVFENFEKAVIKRHDQNSSFAFSSGHDAGVIGCAYKKLKIDVDAITFGLHEDYDVLKSRIKIHQGKLLKEVEASAEDKKNIMDIQSHEYINDTLTLDRYCHMGKLLEDKNKKIIILGEGGDDIFSDYGIQGRKLRARSKFGGYFPNDLSLVWPWHNNYNILEALCTRLDFIFGYYGKEVRLPMLDVDLVQSWLNTTSSLKNSGYKDWMCKYMQENGYPISKMKVGMGGRPVALHG